MYEKGLEEAAASATHHRIKESNEVDERDIIELSDFLAELPIKKTMETCTPLDLLVSITQQWIPTHAIKNGFPQNELPEPDPYIARLVSITKNSKPTKHKEIVSVILNKLH